MASLESVDITYTPSLDTDWWTLTPCTTDNDIDALLGPVRYQQTFLTRTSLSRDGLKDREGLLVRLQDKSYNGGSLLGCEKSTFDATSDVKMEIVSEIQKMKIDFESEVTKLLEEIRNCRQSIENEKIMKCMTEKDQISYVHVLSTKSSDDSSGDDRERYYENERDYGHRRTSKKGNSRNVCSESETELMRRKDNITTRKKKSDVDKIRKPACEYAPFSGRAMGMNDLLSMDDRDHELSSFHKPLIDLPVAGRMLTSTEQKSSVKIKDDDLEKRHRRSRRQTSGYASYDCFETAKNSRSKSKDNFYEPAKSALRKQNQPTQDERSRRGRRELNDRSVEGRPARTLYFDSSDDDVTRHDKKYNDSAYHRQKSKTRRDAIKLGKFDDSFDDDDVTRHDKRYNDSSFHRQKSKIRRDAIKPGKFDGVTGQCLEAFLAQFNNAASYNGWTMDDCLSQLQSCLIGNAAQIIWENPGHHFTYYELVDRLHQRFGSAGQEVQYKSQLKSRRRGKQETIQGLYADICRLLSLAYPNQLDLNVTQEIGIDFFLEALDNPDLERRVREKELDTLDKTFRCCLKLEAQDKALAMRTDARRVAPHVARNVHTDAVVEQLQMQMDQLLLVQQKTETECKQLRNELKQARSASNAAMNKPYVPLNESMKANEVRNRTEMNQMPVDETNEMKQGNSRKSIRCYNCNRFGHISRECKSVKRTSVTEPVDTAAASSTPYIGSEDARARLNSVSDRLSTEQDVYIKI